MCQVVAFTNLGDQYESSEHIPVSSFFGFDHVTVSQTKVKLSKKIIPSLFLRGAGSHQFNSVA